MQGRDVQVLSIEICDWQYEAFKDRTRCRRADRSFRKKGVQVTVKNGGGGAAGWKDR